jgi:hypothetical protein
MGLTARVVAGGMLLIGVPAALWCQGAAPPIRDNSFLIEEAYNQDRNVVQHIATFADARNGGWEFSFTDEWPLSSVRDQLSVGVVLLDAGAAAEFDALALNYRRQVIGNPDAAVIVSPRLSLFADVGSSDNLPFAMQVNLPVTAVLSRSVVSHWNLGVLVSSGPAIVNAGASIVWLTTPWLNFLVEGLYLGEAGDRGAYVMSPGVRGAFNVGAVQVVPGIAFPFDLENRDNDAVFSYLSIEHPFGPTGAE